MRKDEPELPESDSHLRTLRRFRNFWASVSAVHVGKNVSIETQMAIVEGMEKAHGK